jgi:hypothetical protein
MRRWALNAAVDVASWLLARIADVVLGRPDGPDYRSKTNRIEDIAVLQDELNALREERRRATRDMLRRGDGWGN